MTENEPFPNLLGRSKEPKIGSLIYASSYQKTLHGGFIVYPIQWITTENGWYIKENSPQLGIFLPPECCLLVLSVYSKEPMILICELFGEYYSLHGRDNEWNILETK